MNYATSSFTQSFPLFWLIILFQKSIPLNSYLQSLLEKGYELVSGGTENHLVLVNLRNKVKACSSLTSNSLQLIIN